MLKVDTLDVETSQIVTVHEGGHRRGGGGSASHRVTAVWGAARTGSTEEEKHVRSPPVSETGTACGTWVPAMSHAKPATKKRLLGEGVYDRYWSLGRPQSGQWGEMTKMHGDGATPTRCHFGPCRT